MWAMQVMGAPLLLAQLILRLKNTLTNSLKKMPIALKKGLFLIRKYLSVCLLKVLRAKWKSSFTIRLTNRTAPVNCVMQSSKPLCLAPASSKAPSTLIKLFTDGLREKKGVLTILCLSVYLALNSFPSGTFSLIRMPRQSKNVNILFIDTSSTARSSELWARCLTLTKMKSESA